MILSGKRILLGVTGSIAAYKAVLILRRLVSEGAEVTVVLTRSAKQFVAPLTFEVLSGRPAYEDLFERHQEMAHLSLAQQADLVLVAPATADFISRSACGLGDDLLATVLLAARCPVLLAPAMDAVMWENAIVRENLRRLESTGIRVIPPEYGALASGLVGEGRLAPEERILSEVAQRLAVRGDLEGEVVLVTAGPTLEPLDPVRYISNRSSGKMGYAIAEAARSRGARVILVSGPTALNPPSAVEYFQVETGEEMRAAVLKFFSEATILVMAAAVADWRPAVRHTGKIKKTTSPFTLEMFPGPDILEEAARSRRHQFIVGFSAETENLHENAKRKLGQKGLDLIVANDITQPGAGFGADTNIVSLLDRWGKIEDLSEQPKEQVAHRILDRIVDLKARHG